jgi:type IV pilus assembly protein PilQ
VDVSKGMLPSRHMGPWRARAAWVGAVVALAAVAGPLAFGRPEGADARISLDVKDGDVADIVRVLSEVAGFQAVFDPGISCRLTLKLHGVPWRSALGATLRACGLGQEEEGDILRIAQMGRLAEEAADQRRFQEGHAALGPHRVLLFHLSYARAQEMAPVLKRLLSPRGDVVFDSRTNTLMVID